MANDWISIQPQGVQLSARGIQQRSLEKSFLWIYGATTLIHGLVCLFYTYTKGDITDMRPEQKKLLVSLIEDTSKRSMKKNNNGVEFNADDLISAVEGMREQVAGKRKLTMRMAEVGSIAEFRFRVSEANQVKLVAHILHRFCHDPTYLIGRAP